MRLRRGEGGGGVEFVATCGFKNSFILHSSMAQGAWPLSTCVKDFTVCLSLTTPSQSSKRILKVQTPQPCPQLPAPSTPYTATPRSNNSLRKPSTFKALIVQSLMNSYTTLREPSIHAAKTLDSKVTPRDRTLQIS